MITEPQITPWNEVTRYRSKNLMDPNNTSESLEQVTDGQIIYTSSHVGSHDESGWTGWTSASNMAAKDGGAVRTAILSGSHGQLRKLRVDSEIDTETLVVSYSASIGDDLYVSGNLDVAKSSSITDLLVTNNSTVKGNSVVSGTLDVNGNTNLHSNAAVTGNLDILGTTSLHSDTTISGNLQVLGDAEVSGSTVLNSTLEVKDNVTLDKDGIISGNLQVLGDTTLDGTLEVKDSTSLDKDLLVRGEGTFEKNVNIYGNLLVNGTASYLNVTDLYVKDKSITVASGSTSASASNGAGFDIAGAGVEFHYKYPEDVMSLNKGLDIQGNENVSGYVSASSVKVTDVSASNISASNITSSNLQVTSASIGQTNVTNLSATGNISSSASGSFKDLAVANNTTTKYETIQGAAGEDALTVQNGNINAGNSNLSVNGITGSYISMSGVVSASTFIGDGSQLSGVTASIVTASTEVQNYNATVADGIYRFTHTLGTTNIIAAIYQDVAGSGSVQIIPEQLSIVDNSTIDIIFGRVATGHVVFAKAGHVINPWDIYDPTEFLQENNIHYGNVGTWKAKEFNAVTSSNQIVESREYIDTPKIGNLDTGTQYYSAAWGSYILFHDTDVETYVKPSADEDPIIMSRQKSNGDLEIRGAVITNATFNTSDRRYKENIKPIEGALEAVKQIPGVKFTWKESGEPGMGTVAQSVQAIYPELTKEIQDLDGNPRLTVDYSGLVGVLLAAVKELSEKVERLENKVKE